MASESVRRSEFREIEVEVSAVAIEIELAPPADVESAGEVVDVPAAITVDGDFNGAPALEALDATGEWQGADALDAMEGRDAQELRTSDEPVAEELLADAVAARRQVLAERLDEAREAGLGSVFEAALAVSEPEAGNSPVVADDDLLRDQLAILDLAIEQLQRQGSAGVSE